MYREGFFYVWLVARKTHSTNLQILRCVGWSIPVDVQFAVIMSADGPGGIDYSKWQNSSAQKSIISPIDNPSPIPPEACNSPTYNSVLALYHYPIGNNEKQFL